MMTAPAIVAKVLTPYPRPLGMPTRTLLRRDVLGDESGEHVIIATLLEENAMVSNLVPIACVSRFEVKMFGNHIS